MLRIVFMGSPDFAVPALERVIERHRVELVVTRPDKPKGRGKRVVPPPVKVVAEAAGAPVFQPKSVKGKKFRARLAEVGADIGVVVAYGKILPLSVLEAFPHGCLNIHASLLPKYRGAAPIQWSLIEGETETGVTIMRLDEGMDTGPVLLERRIEVGPADNAGTLSDRLSELGAEMLLEALERIEDGTAVFREQNHDAATYAPMLKKEDGVVDWNQAAEAVANRIRGVDPWPGAVTTLDGQPLKLFAASLAQADEPGDAEPGQVLGIDKRGLRVACRQGVCVVAEVQAAGRKRMAARAFVAGRPMPVGTRLGR
jgi:methionyl-tRNA formyltransferase